VWAACEILFKFPSNLRKSTMICFVIWILFPKLFFSGGRLIPSENPGVWGVGFALRARNYAFPWEPLNFFEMSQWRASYSWDVNSTFHIDEIFEKKTWDQLFKRNLRGCDSCEGAVTEFGPSCLRTPTFCHTPSRNRDYWFQCTDSWIFDFFFSVVVVISGAVNILTNGKHTIL